MAPWRSGAQVAIRRIWDRIKLSHQMSICLFTIILILELSAARDLQVSLAFHKTRHEGAPFFRRMGFPFSKKQKIEKRTKASAGDHEIINPSRRP